MKKPQNFSFSIKMAKNLIFLLVFSFHRNNLEVLFYIEADVA